MFAYIFNPADAGPYLGFFDFPTWKGSITTDREKAKMWAQRGWDFRVAPARGSRLPAWF